MTINEQYHTKDEQKKSIFFKKLFASLKIPFYICQRNQIQTY